MTTDTQPAALATIFLAHSTIDVKAARQVRNLFEDMDHDVLLLKLSQQMTEDYLKTLLEREIQAHDWLVMLSSDNTDRSDWVAFETRFAREKHKPVFEIDLTRCTHETEDALRDCLQGQVSAVSRNIRVFLSYSRTDQVLAERLRADLSAQGFEVWREDPLGDAKNLAEQFTEAIDNILARGAMVLVLNDASLDSEFVMDEVRYALMRKGRVVPCLAEPLTRPLPPDLAEILWTDFSQSYDDGLSRLVNVLQQIDPAPHP